MNQQKTVEDISLETTSPFELRAELSKGVPESVVKRALATGDTGFVHSFTTGSAVDGPGIRLVAWTAGCQFRCLYCHNPDTWNMMNGMAIPLERAVAAAGLIADILAGDQIGDGRRQAREPERSEDDQ